MQLELLDTDTQKNANKRRVMKPVDIWPADVFVYDDDGTELPEMGEMECPECGHNDGWWYFKDMNEMQAGIPCPKCNQVEVCS